MASKDYYDRCPICLGAYFFKTMPDGCNHIFCKPCIVDWRDQKDECPICRIKFTRVFTPAVIPRVFTSAVNPNGAEEIIIARVKGVPVSSEMIEYLLCKLEVEGVPVSSEMIEYLIYGGPYRRR